MNGTLAIVHEDAHCLAVVKPPGQFTLGTWAPADEITLETAVRRYLDPAEPASVYLGIVHRLDRPTSGLLIWAKTPKAARRLSSQFERRRALKEYWAIVECDRPIADADQRDEIWTDWLTRADAKGVVHCVEPRSLGAREAITRVRFEATGALAPGLAWLRLWPQTGRTHQLRAQAGRRGLPIVGDTDYGATARSIVPRGIALHARSLEINHPVTGILMKLSAPLPLSWSEGGITLADQAER